ncbi:MAG: hypothetical protein AAB553_04725 [Patescibacteria group bacterium]|mgnify:CR=1 FL=1
MLGELGEGGHVPFFPDRGAYHRERGIRPEQYISVEEYLRRVALIQPAIHSVLEKIAETNASPSIEAVLVEGSYGSSHPLLSPRVWVHDASDGVSESDLDTTIIIPESSTNHETNSFYGYVEGMLAEDDLPLVTDHWRDRLYLSDPEEKLRKALANDPHDEEELRKGSGLLFIRPGSLYRDRIISLFEQNNFPVVLNPATEAQVIRRT